MESNTKPGQQDGFLDESIDRDQFMQGLEKIQSQDSPQKDFSITFEPKDGLAEPVVGNSNTSSHENELNKAVVMEDGIAGLTAEPETASAQLGSSPPKVIHIGEDEDFKHGRVEINLMKMHEEVKVGGEDMIYRNEEIEIAVEENRPREKEAKTEKCLVDEPHGVRATCCGTCNML